jgi:uncharacterized protein (DUF2267 family)
MANNKVTTIKISSFIKKILDENKIHHRETYDDILIRMLNIIDNKIDAELNQELNSKLKNDLNNMENK